MGVYYHPRHAISPELSPQLGLIRQITPKYKKIKIIDKVEQSVYIGVSKGAEFKNSIYFVLRSLLHCVWAWFLFKVSSIRQIVVGWIFRNIRPWYLVSGTSALPIASYAYSYLLISAIIVAQLVLCDIKLTNKSVNLLSMINRICTHFLPLHHGSSWITYPIGVGSVISILMQGVSKQDHQRYRIGEPNNLAMLASYWLITLNCIGTKELSNRLSHQLELVPTVRTCISWNKACLFGCHGQSLQKRCCQVKCTYGGQMYWISLRPTILLDWLLSLA